MLGDSVAGIEDACMDLALGWSRRQCDAGRERYCCRYAQGWCHNDDYPSIPDVDYHSIPDVGYSSIPAVGYLFVSLFKEPC